MLSKGKVKRWHVLLGSLVVSLGGMVYLSYAKNQYGVGWTLKEMGLACCSSGSYEHFDWKPTSLERIPTCLSRRRMAAQQFDGTVVAANAHESEYIYMTFKKGKYDSGPFDAKTSLGKSLVNDISLAKASGLQGLIERGTCDWRIDHVASASPPVGAPFTGELSLYPENLFGWHTTFQVVDDRIVSTNRYLGFYFD